MEMDILGSYSVICFAKGDNVCDFLFHFPYTEHLYNKDYCTKTKYIDLQDTILIL